MVPGLIESGVGPVNGVNKIFTVSALYLAGSSQVWLNGLLLRKDGTNGWAELGANKISMDEAPVPGDIIQVFYRPI
jgi:hypothetical protein